MIVLHPAFLADAEPRLIAAPLIVTDAWAWEDPSNPTGTARVVPVPAREIAADLGVPVAAGLALVGVFAELTGVADDESLATATRQLVPPHRAAALEANLAALRGRRRGPGHAGGDRLVSAPRHRRHGARPLQGLRAVRPRVPPRRAGDDRRAQRQGLRAAAPPRRVHRMSRVRRGVPRLRVRGVPLRHCRADAEVVA